MTGRTKDNTAFPLTVKFTNISQNLSLGDLYSPSHSLPMAPSEATSSTAAHTCSRELVMGEDGDPGDGVCCDSGDMESASRPR